MRFRAPTNDAGWVHRLRELHLLTPLRIVAILLGAWLVAFAVRHVVQRFVRGLQIASERVSLKPDHGRLDQRRRTLNTVLRSTIVAVVWLVATITVLGELGINLGAFVATATIIGGAIAFGAQTLVRDIIAGFFMIAEDQFGVGDVVDLGTASGTVERVSLRTTRLRDDYGRVWYVPNGQITRVGNLTQGKASAVVDVTVDLSDDLDVAGRRLVELGRDLRSDPTFGPLITADPVFLGVESLGASSAVLRLSLETQPGAQFTVRRAYLSRIAASAKRGEMHELGARDVQGDSSPTGGTPPIVP